MTIYSDERNERQTPPPPPPQKSERVLKAERDFSFEISITDGLRVGCGCLIIFAGLALILAGLAFTLVRHFGGVVS